MGDDRSKGTVVVNLRHPKTVDGETCEQLTMRREIAGDSRDAQRGGGTPAEIEMRLFANLCEVAPGVIEQLGLGNYRQTAGAVPGFFGKLTRVGDVAATLPAPAALLQMVGWLLIYGRDSGPFNPAPAALLQMVGWWRTSS